MSVMSFQGLAEDKCSKINYIYDNLQREVNR